MLNNKKVQYVFVDLDKTLIKTDSLVENIFDLFLREPLSFFKVILTYLVSNKLEFKKYIYLKQKRRQLYFPIREDLVDYLNYLKSEGNIIVLRSASYLESVKNIIRDNNLDYLFDYVYGSESINLKGSEKHKKIKEIIAYLNKQKNLDLTEADCIYCGDSKDDLAIWEHIGQAIIAGRKAEYLKNKLEKSHYNSKEIKLFSEKESVLFGLLKAMRLHQWAKNALIFIPLLISFNFNKFGLVFDAFLTFLIFSIGASSTYILNDIWDIQNDRQHLTKKNRPFASGVLSPFLGLFISLSLIFCTLIYSYLFFDKTFGIYISYLLITSFYSFVLKKLPILDIITLSGLYTIRIIAGNLSCDIAISYWLLAFSILFFLSLAFLKRYTEIKNKEIKTGKKVLILPGRAYSSEDSMFLLGSGLASYISSVVIFGLYITSPVILTFYRAPELLYLVQLILIYLVGNMWYLANRGQMNDDPVLFFVKDIRCLFCIFLIGIVFLISHFGF